MEQIASASPIETLETVTTENETIEEIYTNETVAEDQKEIELPTTVEIENVDEVELSDVHDKNDSKLAEDEENKRYEKLKIIYNGRDILDFSANIGNQSWNVNYTYLPENNFQMYLANRSQYHRLSANWNTKGYILDTCRKCFFQYPVKFPHDQMVCGDSSDNVSTTNTNTITNINKNNNMPWLTNNNSSIPLNMNQPQKQINQYNTNANSNYHSLPTNRYAMNRASAFKQNSNQFFNDNDHSTNNGYINNIDQHINHNNGNNLIKTKQFYYNYQQNNNNFGNNNNNNNTNNYGKVPYKMYTHF